MHLACKNDSTRTHIPQVRQSGLAAGSSAATNLPAPPRPAAAAAQRGGGLREGRGRGFRAAGGVRPHTLGPEHSRWGSSGAGASGTGPEERAWN